MTVINYLKSGGKKIDLTETEYLINKIKSNIEDAYTPYDVGNYIRFYSDTSFSIMAAQSWNGTIEYSTDKITWTVWNGDEQFAANNGTTYNLYMRGTNNTIITGNVGEEWTLNGSDIHCTGNIENLLDYQSVANNTHPIMDDYCFAGMFSEGGGNIGPLIEAPELPATTLSRGCYYYMFATQGIIMAPELPATILAEHCYDSMFAFCHRLVKAPELPATTLARDCYQFMFDNCWNLLEAPELPSITLSDYCYNGMFADCHNLIKLPELPATTLAIECYRTMFLNCRKIKLSTIQTGEYQNEFRIPKTGFGIDNNDGLLYMFNGTGGTFTGTPDINTTYYTSNEIVGGGE